MIEVLKTIALRLALCGAATWLVWRAGFDTGLVFMAGLYGICLARPLLDLASAFRHEMRRAQWRDVQGRHFSFRGHPVHVLEDDDHQRWIRLSDVRAIAGFTASDGALRLTYPNGWRLCGRPASPHLSDEALLAHLAKERAPTAAKLRHWVEREIVFPARRRRERHAVRHEALDFRARD
jgi:hypothetical protein